MKRWTTGAAFALALAMASPAAAQTAPGTDDAGAQALTELTQAHPNARATTRDGAVTSLTGVTVETTGDTPQARAEDFVARYAGAFGVGAEQLAFSSTSERRGRATVRFTQVAGDLPVEGRALTVTFDAQGRVRRVLSDVSPLRSIARGPVEAPAAVAAATASIHGSPEARLSPTAPVLVVLAGDGVGAQGVLAWKVPVVASPLLGHVFVYVDTRDERVLRVQPTAIIE